MTLYEEDRWLRVSIGEAIVRTTENVRISASLDQLNRVCMFDLAQQPSSTPADGADVIVDLVNTTDGVYYTIFGGEVDGGPETESEPFAMTVRAVDQLSKLRIVRTGTDLDLTGMTVKEAKMEIFDYCGIDYDSSDIVNVTYELGALEPVKWLADGSTTAAQLIQEIDRIFGLTTQTVGNNRVISFRYELMPDDATGLYRTFTKGSSFDFAAHHRTRGSRNDIQTLWHVTGVDHEFNDGNCTSTPWAKSVHGTAKVGRSARTPTSTDQSDLIQDEALAEYVVRQHMSRTSGIPDSGTAAVTTSRNLHPGTKIAIQDNTYGITALPRYYCVTNVEITGLRTDLTLVAGPPGNEGTVTTGVDRVCNETHTDTDIPGDYDPPDFDFPPLDDGTIDDIPFPDVEFEEPEVPNIVDPFLDCTESGELVDFISLDWRETGDNVSWRYDSGADETLGVYTLLTGEITYNITEAPTIKTDSNDFVFAQDETVCVSGTVKFCNQAASEITPRLGISLLPDSALDPGQWPNITFWSEPGAQDPFIGEFWGVSSVTENTQALFYSGTEVHQCAPFSGSFAWNGGYEGEPVGDGEHSFSVCFQTDTPKNRNYYDGDFGGGYHEDLVCLDGEEVVGSPTYQTCSHPAGHVVTISMIGSNITPATVDCPWVELTSINLGFGTCTPNPDYVDPGTVEEEEEG